MKGNNLNLYLIAKKAEELFNGVGIDVTYECEVEPNLDDEIRGFMYTERCNANSDFIFNLAYEKGVEIQKLTFDISIDLFPLVIEVDYSLQVGIITVQGTHGYTEKTLQLLVDLATFLSHIDFIHNAEQNS